MLAVPSKASLSSLRKTPQKGTTWVEQKMTKVSQVILMLFIDQILPNHLASRDVERSGHNLLVLRRCLVLSHGVL